MQTVFKQIYNKYRGYFLNIVALYRQKPDVRRFLELFLNLTAATIFSIFAIKPTVNTIIGLTKEIKAKEDTIAKMDEKINNLKTAQNTYYQKKAAIDILNQSIPSLPSPDLLARQIEAVTKLNSLEPGSITFSSAALKGKDTSRKTKEEFAGLPNKIRAISISINGKSTYESILSFITSLENMRRPFKIDSLSISKKGVSKEESSEDLVFSVSGRVPFYDINAEAVKSPAKKTEENIVGE